MSLFFTLHLNSGTISQSYLGHEAPITGLTYSRSLDAIASCSVDGTVKIWKDKITTSKITKSGLATLFRVPSIQSIKKSNRLSTVSNTSDISIASFQSLHDQLQQAQAVINKQERNKLRLKGELSGSISELSIVKQELEDTRKKLSMTEKIVVELEASKGLLTLPDSDLQFSQETQYIAVKMIFRSADRQYQNTAVELANFYCLLERDQKTCNAPVLSRSWEWDSDWDSPRDCTSSEA
jgi:WD40 repeat protein